ncbi:TetR/AcrR family transcriptional regulator [Paenibacillus sp. HB172176]|uniref:TetR/AcrR family transcriptional regulator n=1 Tax=Paenibacillus sp. HB172176 TaxID=2493690 RepID=UPI00143A5EC9|nr:TetR/AcrR family transcriptional regulator [Paenibacillus sp. HB172176]
MADNVLDPTCEKRKLLKEKLVLKLLPSIQKQGFSLLKMDDAAKHMDISKATMYKYFASKDDIISCLVRQCAEFIIDQMLEEAPRKFTEEQLSNPSDEDRRLYCESFAVVFKLTTKLTYYLTDAFLQDLGTAYPDLSAELSQSVDKFQKKLIAYLESGMELGVFNRLNATLLLIQLDVVLRKLLDPKLLMLHNMTLKQALLDFYIAMKHQVFNEKWLLRGTDEIEPFIDKMILKMLSSD